MAKSKLKITRIDSSLDVRAEVDRIEFEYQTKKYVITPDFDGFRIHKSAIDNDGLFIKPGCSNEIIVK